MDVNLDKLVLSAASVAVWQKLALRIAEVIRTSGLRIDPRLIPDEQARVEADGSLTIYVVIPDLGEMSMSVPADQWEFANRSMN